LFADYISQYSSVVRSGKLDSKSKKILIDTIKGLSNKELPKKLHSMLQDVLKKLEKMGGADKADIIDLINKLTSEQLGNLHAVIIKMLEGKSGGCDSCGAVGRDEDFVIELGGDDMHIAERSASHLDRRKSSAFSVVGMNEESDEAVIELYGGDEFANDSAEVLRKFCDYLIKHIARYGPSVVFSYVIEDDTLVVNMNGTALSSKCDTPIEVAKVINFLVAGLTFVDTKILKATSSSEALQSQTPSAERLEIIARINELLDQVVGLDDADKQKEVVIKILGEIERLISPDVKETCVMKLAKYIEEGVSRGDKEKLKAIYAL